MISQADDLRVPFIGSALLLLDSMIKMPAALPKWTLIWPASEPTWSSATSDLVRIVLHELLHKPSPLSRLTLLAQIVACIASHAIL
jgi:hypothetical protein